MGNRFRVTEHELSRVGRRGKKIINRGRGAEFAKNHGRNSRDDDHNRNRMYFGAWSFLFFHFKVELWARLDNKYHDLHWRCLIFLYIFDYLQQHHDLSKFSISSLFFSIFFEREVLARVGEKPQTYFPFWMALVAYLLYLEKDHPESCTTGCL